jgi:hypothetical protein
MILSRGCHQTMLLCFSKSEWSTYLRVYRANIRSSKFLPRPPMMNRNQEMRQASRVLRLALCRFGPNEIPEKVSSLVDMIVKQFTGEETLPCHLHSDLRRRPLVTCLVQCRLRFSWWTEIILASSPCLLLNVNIFCEINWRYSAISQPFFVLRFT